MVNDKQEVINVNVMAVRENNRQSLVVAFTHVFEEGSL